MSLPKKFAALVAPMMGLALVFAVSAAAQPAPAPGTTPAKVDTSNPSAETPKKKTTVTRHAWSKKHYKKTENHPKKKAKAKGTS